MSENIPNEKKKISVPFTKGVLHYIDYSISFMPY